MGASAAHYFFYGIGLNFVPSRHTVRAVGLFYPMVSSQVPRNLLSKEAAVLVTTKAAVESLSLKAEISDLEPLPCIIVSKADGAPWKTCPFNHLITEAERRQIAIYSEDLDAFVVGLCFTALEIGFQTFFICPDPYELSLASILRLTHASVVILSLGDAIEELRMTAP